MSRFSITGFKLFAALLIALALMATPALWELKHPAPRQQAVAIGWPWVWFTRVAPVVIPCVGTVYGENQPKVCTTPEEYAEYSVEPGALVATLVLYFTSILLLLMILFPKSIPSKEEGNPAESADAVK